MKIIICFLCAFLLAQPALAFDKIFAKQCKNVGIPKDLAMAVARQESGLKPYCINVAGKDYWPETYDAAVAIVRKAQKEDKSYDVGLMQINSQWVKQWKIDPVILLDPETNIRFGLRLLKEEVARFGLNWRAVASYHSPNPEQGRLYAIQVYSRLRGKAVLKSMMANGRLRGRFPGRKGRLGHFQLPTLPDAELMKQANMLRRPIGLEASR